MWGYKLSVLILSLLHTQSVLSWTCTQNADCSSTEGALCLASNCACAPGQEMVFGGSLCADRSPYYTWPCVEDHQCTSLVTNFQCRKNSAEHEQGNCFCREGFHYFSGRCWPSINYESTCTRDEECQSTLRDPFSMLCDASGTCTCAEGYYRRQWGECRKIGYAAGDSCVLDEDCQFADGLCNINTFSCYLPGSEQDEETSSQESILRQLSAVTVSKNGANVTQHGRGTRQHGVECSATNLCAAPFTCSNYGLCICPSGYYVNGDGTACLAELGSRSTEAQCVGVLAEVRDGICTCPPNFYFEENMRDCVKVARILSDSCLADNNCHTFGAAARCGEPVLPWFIRSCECIPELSVWDEERHMCRLFSGIGDVCREDSDCLAGDLEISCVLDASGEGVCTCPAGTTAQDGLCLTTGLQLGDVCQASAECTGADNSGCYEGVCGCSEGYQEFNGFCAPVIGGTCSADTDCVVEDTVCVTDAQNQATCQCQDGYVDGDNACWPYVLDIESVCNVSAQCVAVMGEASACVDERCVCSTGHHYRDGGCWPQIGLFEGCLRTSECYLQDMSARVECRNSLCQCSFDYPYSIELDTCTSAASTTMASLLTIVAAMYHVWSH